MEKEMAAHSSILTWKNPWTEESGGLKSMGLHDWACVHEGGGRWVGSNKLVELKKKKIKVDNVLVRMWRIGNKYRTSLLAQMVKRLSTLRETRAWSLGQEDPLEKETTAQSSTLAWEIPWTVEPGGLQSMGSQRVGHDWETPPQAVLTLYSNELLHICHVSWNHRKQS